MKKFNNLILLSVFIGSYLSFANAQDACLNVALNRPATASTISGTEVPSRAFDGNLTSNWSANEHNGWIKVDLQNKVSVDSMKLYVNQYYAGNTVHEIKISEDMVNWVLVKTLSGYTSNNQVIKVNFNPVLTNVRGVMINTPTTNSWVAWFEIQIFANPYKPTITQDGFLLTSSSATNNQWYLNGNPITNAKSQSYTVTATGTYQVGITSVNGCISLSEEVYVTKSTTAVNEIEKKDVRIYPNPAKDNVIIEGAVKAKIEVYNLQGQVLKEVNASESKTSVDISNLTNGVYSIKITTTEGIIVKKLLKE